MVGARPTLRARCLRRRGRLFALILASALFAGPALAQSVEWSLPERLVAGATGALELVFTDCSPEGDPALPEIDGLDVLGTPSRSSSFTMQNFKSSSSVTLGYRVRPTRPGEIRVPAFDVETDEGVLRVAATSLTAGRLGGTSEPDVIFEIVPSKRDPWVGEVIDFDLTVYVASGQGGELSSPPSWEPSGLIAEDWSEGESIRRGGRSGLRFHARGYAIESGVLDLPPVSIELQLQTGRRRGFGLFQQRETMAYQARTKPLQLDVRALPEPAPDGFDGAVGRFELESRAVPDRVEVGEPITWTLTLSGRGNWPSGVRMPARSVPRDMRVLQPAASREFAEGVLFDGRMSEDVVLIPEQSGVLDLRPVRFWAFDPGAGEYRLATAPTPSVAVAPSPGPPIGRASKSAPSPEEEPASQPLARAPGAISPDTPPPLDALEVAKAEPRTLRPPRTHSEYAPAPWPIPLFVALLSTPFVLALIECLRLALRHARLHDPMRARQRERRALSALLDRIDAAAPEERRALLVDWQRGAVRLLGIEHAVPTPEQIAARVGESGLGRDPVEGVERDWVALYRESIDALHTPDGRLPEDFATRARRVLDALRIPRAGLFDALRWRHLAPLGVLLTALVVVPDPGAESVRPGAEAYAEGDFAGAIEAQREALAQAPSDWTLRHDLALSYAQDDRPAPAVAAALSAFLHAPRSEAVAWNLDLLARALPAVDERVVRLLGDGPRAQVARQASPFEWQLLAVVATSLLAIALVIVVRDRHRAGGRGARRLAALAAWAGLLVGLAAANGLEVYGALGRPEAALTLAEGRLRSLPTQAVMPHDDAQIPVGEVVRAPRRFLGWVRIERANGEQGWLRQTDLLPLYGEPWIEVEAPIDVPAEPGGQAAT